MLLAVEGVFDMMTKIARTRFSDRCTQIFREQLCFPLGVIPLYMYMQNFNGENTVNIFIILLRRTRLTSSFTFRYCIVHIVSSLKEMKRV